MQSGPMRHTYRRYQGPNQTSQLIPVPAENAHLEMGTIHIRHCTQDLPYPSLPDLIQSFLEMNDQVALCDIIGGTNVSEQWSHRNLQLDNKPSLITLGFALEGSLSGTGQINGAPLEVAVTFDVEFPSTSSLQTTVSPYSTTSLPHTSLTCSHETITAQTGLPQSTITVDVGTFVNSNGSVAAFRPSHICAPPETLILFNMLADSHSVTQSSFDEPCKHTGGFDTGLIPNINNMTGAHVESYRVETSSPSWFFCKQTSHCQQGMVFAINPESADQMVEFVSKAMHQAEMDSYPTAASIVIDTSSTEDCGVASTTWIPNASGGLFGTNPYHTGTRIQSTDTGSTGYAPRPTGSGWNASSSSKTHGAPATPRPPSSVYIAPSSTIQMPVVSMGSACKLHVLLFATSASLFVILRGI